MKKILKNILPQALIEFIKAQQGISAWKKRGFLDNTPQLVKQNVFLKYGIKDATY